MNDDIIVALGTARQEAAISIVRLSGKGCIEFVDEIPVLNSGKRKFLENRCEKYQVKK